MKRNTGKREGTVIRRKKIEKKGSRKKTTDWMRVLCWAVIPSSLALLLTLDALCLYTFNNERLLVLGIFLFVLLLPFFSEISVKDLTVRREARGEEGPKRENGQKED